MSKVYITNTGESDFSDRFNGQPFTIPAGSRVIADSWMRNHLLGDPAIAPGTKEYGHQERRLRARWSNAVTSDPTPVVYRTAGLSWEPCDIAVNEYIQPVVTLAPEAAEAAAPVERKGARKPKPAAEVLEPEFPDLDDQE